MPPAAATSSAVPRSGCSAISSVGTPMATATTSSDSEARRQRPLVQIPRAGQRHRELHDFRGLKAHEAQVEPALRAHRDVADEHHDEQQQQADARKPRARRANEARRNLRQHDHRDQAEREAHQLRLEHRRLLPRGAEQHDAADGAHQAQRDEQRAVQVQREQQPRGAGQCALSSRGVERCR